MFVACSQIRQRERGEAAQLLAPGSHLSGIACVLPAPRVSLLAKHREKCGQRCSWRHEHTKALFLFPLLTDQDEGLLVANKCMYKHIYNVGLSRNCPEDHLHSPCRWYAIGTYIYKLLQLQSCSMCWNSPPLHAHTEIHPHTFTHTLHTGVHLVLPLPTALAPWPGRCSTLPFLREPLCRKNIKKRV